MKILLIEEDHALADSLVHILKTENYDVDICYDGRNGLEFALNAHYDVMALDIMLPYINGVDVIKQIRNHNILTPILILTTKISLKDKVEGLDSGADDYMTKPFLVGELLARLRALCRRPRDFYMEILHYEDIDLNVSKCEMYCTKTNKTVQLGQKELLLLECMMQHKEQIISREQLTLKVWGYDNDTEYNKIEVYISFTRNKIKLIGSNVKIKAVRGMGYKIQAC